MFSSQSRTVRNPPQPAVVVPGRTPAATQAPQTLSERFAQQRQIQQTNRVARTVGQQASARFNAQMQRRGIPVTQSMQTEVSRQGTSNFNRRNVPGEPAAVNTNRRGGAVYTASGASNRANPSVFRRLGEKPGRSSGNQANARGGSGRGGNRGASRGGRGGNRRRNQPRPAQATPVTQEQLDKELDDYLKQGDVEMES